MTSFPWLTAAFVAAALVLGAVPDAVDSLEYRHPETTAGAWWRPFTGQLVHWTRRMTVADLGAVAILGALLERRSRRAAALAMAGAVAVAGLGLHLLPPAVGRYRGSSSVASGLFVALAADLRREPATRRLATAALLAFAVKVGFETATGRALFAGAMPEGVTVLPRAHLLGGLGGLAGWVGASIGMRAGARNKADDDPGPHHPPRPPLV